MFVTQSLCHNRVILKNEKKDYGSSDEVVENISAQYFSMRNYTIELLSKLVKLSLYNDNTTTQI